jgi:response regulator of citrate/malate metabolism
MNTAISISLLKERAKEGAKNIIAAYRINQITEEFIEDLIVKSFRDEFNYTLEEFEIQKERMTAAERAKEEAIESLAMSKLRTEDLERCMKSIRELSLSRRWQRFDVSAENIAIITDTSRRPNLP